MSNWIRWNELTERWNLADHELIDYIRQGLQPYFQNTGNLYDCPQEFHFGYHAKMRIAELTDQIEKQTTELLNSGTAPYLIYSDSGVSDLQDERSIHKKQLDKFINEDPYCRSWEHFTFGRDEEKVKKLISELKNHVKFKLKDIEDFEKKQGLVRKETASKTQDVVGKEIKNLKTKRPRTKVAGAIYRAAALRARIVLRDQIQAGLLPASATRKEKLDKLKTDKEFQKIIAPLKCSDEYLIRKLGEANPGLWQLGKPSHGSIVK